MNGHSNGDINGTKSSHPKSDDQTRIDVQEYYGKVLSKSSDLKTDACTTSDNMPRHVRQIASKLADEVIIKYYGCGIVAPDCLEGCRVLDLGCGAGRDCYILSGLVGPDGYVVGVDMTDEQLDVANKYIDYHQEQFGYPKPNTEFKKGYIERLDELGFEDNSFDVVISNCVINLSPDKDAVLREVYRILKPGGELYFSDVYSDRRVPRELVEDPVLFGECLSGALYWKDFLRLSQKNGFIDPRKVKGSTISIQNEHIESLIGHIRFCSMTYRLFKIPELEDACEDYGQAVVYKGTIPNCPKTFALDDHHLIDTGRVFPVCRNTWYMLKNTRFEEHFTFIGDDSVHYGIYAGCGDPGVFADLNQSGAPVDGGGCC
mmetsp:Transcript_20721/g.29973  ORF Transcript_20721/g.29973 Transcript_20721/m.29973 type:complete len:374 (-) Transcript_20721:249-1370(-)